MNSSPENHENLRKLLALKRHEHPPPGFFPAFSAKVIARIEAESVVRRRPWWQQWFAEMAEQPLLASTYGMLFAGLVVVAIGLAQSPPAENAELVIPGTLPYYNFTEAAIPRELPFRLMIDSNVVSSSSLSPAPLPFGIPMIPVERAAFQP
jgi:hypothetical protein